MSTNWKGLDHAPVWFVYLKIAAPAFYPCLVLCLRGFYLSYVIPGGIGMFQVYCSITVDKVDLSAIYCYISTEPIFFFSQECDGPQQRCYHLTLFWKTVDLYRLTGFARLISAFVATASSAESVSKMAQMWGGCWDLVQDKQAANLNWSSLSSKNVSVCLRMLVWLLLLWKIPLTWWKYWWSYLSNMDRYYRKVYIYCANNTKYGRGALKLSENAQVVETEWSLF